ncbi:MAG: zinc ribbon domain-containing protein [Promethearchaeota archaeon]
MAFQDETESPGALMSLGKSMKLYAKSLWIEIGGIVALIFITSILMAGSLMSGGESGVENGILVLVGGMIALEIFVLIRYFQLILQMKVTGESTNSLQLQNSTKYLFAAAITSVLFRLYSEFFGGGSISQMLALDFTGMTAEEMLLAIDSTTTPMSTLTLVLATIPLVFQFLFAMTFYKWAQTLSADHSGDFLYTAVERGANVIKIGSIIMLIPYIDIMGPFIILLEIIAPLILLLGYGKTGKAILIISPNHRSTAYGNQTHPGHTPFDARPSASPSSAESEFSFPSDSSPTPTPKRVGPLTLCPFCGTQLPSPDAKFCSMCGREFH